MGLTFPKKGDAQVRSSSGASYTRSCSVPPRRSYYTLHIPYRTPVWYYFSLCAGWPPYPYRECLPSPCSRCRGYRTLPSQLHSSLDSGYGGLCHLSHLYLLSHSNWPRKRFASPSSGELLRGRVSP